MFNNLIVWVFLGAGLGWLAGRLTPTRPSWALNVVVGIMGAGLTGWLLAPQLGISTADEAHVSLPALLMAVLGAGLLLTLVNLFRWRLARAALGGRNRT